MGLLHSDSGAHRHAVQTIHRHARSLDVESTHTSRGNTQGEDDHHDASPRIGTKRALSCVTGIGKNSWAWPHQFIGRGYEERPAESLEVHDPKVIIDRHVTSTSGAGILSNEGYSAVQGPPPPRLALSASLAAHACSAACRSAGDIAQPTKTPPKRSPSRIARECLLLSHTNVNVSLTCPGTTDGLARRAM
jgi:hypothetical protein